jgi:hypothetical protein
VEIQHEVVTVCGPAAVAVQHARKCCREFGNGRVSAADGQRSGRTSTCEERVEYIGADRRVMGA